VFLLRGSNSEEDDRHPGDHDGQSDQNAQTLAHGESPSSPLEPRDGSSGGRLRAVDGSLAPGAKLA
jgi:hypothetical protein